MPLNIRFSGTTTPEVEVINYPGGELQVRITDVALPQFLEATVVRITAWLGGGQDLMALLLLKDAIDALPPMPRKVQLYLPYLPYARADRRFVAGDCWGLGVFATVINSARFTSVEVLDPHNADVAWKLINGLAVRSATPYIGEAVKAFAQFCNRQLVTVLLPDEGAAQRYEDLPSMFGAVRVQYLTAKKVRDQRSGILTGFKVPARSEFASPAVLIVDDICDGGGTFLGIANKLLYPSDVTKPPWATLGLCVTHGIFSQGLRLLGEFSRIYTTDSWKRGAPLEDPNNAVQIMSTETIYE